MITSLYQDMREPRSFYLIPILLLLLRPAGAQSPATAHLKTGKEIFEAGCAGCHGRDGTGGAQSTIGFEKPETFPDFTRCDQTTPEADEAWRSIIRDGGRSRAFSTIMPSFREALSPEQIEAVIGYLRGFCREKGWPRGEMNLPLAMVTEKAFPENEEVVITAINAQGAPGFASEFVHEQRFGRRTQLEVAVPVEFQRPEPGLWFGGLGDIGIGLKRVLFSSLETGSIFSLLGVANIPTGNKQHGLGTGTPIFETNALYGQLLPARFFLQMQGGAELPADTSKAPQAVYLRGNIGRTFNQNEGLGRLWVPMFEVLADRDLVTGAKTNIDVMPEFQVTLSRRQHVRLGLGLRIPANNTADRSKMAMFYLLWDWADGGLREGW